MVGSRTLSNFCVLFGYYQHKPSDREALVCVAVCIYSKGLISDSFQAVNRIRFH